MRMGLFRSLPYLIALVIPYVVAQRNAHEICAELGSTLSTVSGVFYPGSSEYDAGVKHWAASSTQPATCVTEPGSADDVAQILRLLGHSRTLFAIKGGGHSTNQGFSSTTGVHIAMSRFRQIEYDAQRSSVVVGAGLRWDDVYKALDPHNATVVGGRVSGIGVAGFTLGGGYSYLSNMYGLASDNVLEYELVLPTGRIVQVNAVSHPDLFFGLRGGFNNLGIVTKFTFKTHPLGLVWGGNVYISPEYAQHAFAATAKFQSENRDPKAAMILGINSVLMPALGPSPVVLLNLLLFYAAPEPAPQTFDDLRAIPTLDLAGMSLPLGTNTYASLVEISDAGGADSYAPRTAFNTYGFTDYSEEFLNVVLSETTSMGQNLVNDSGMSITVAIEPFLDSVLRHSSIPSLYPANRDQVYLPTNLYMTWADPAKDEFMHDAARGMIKRLKDSAVAMGHDLGKGDLYPNYALFGEGTSVEEFWGQEHVKSLQLLRKIYDPADVMGLTGGWRV